MSQKLDITLSQEQVELLLNYVDVDELGRDIVKQLKSPTIQGGSFSFLLSPAELDEVYGSVLIASNKNDIDEEIVLELDKLSDLLDSYLEFDN